MVDGSKKFVGIVPGVRITFTCLSATEVIKIGEKLIQEIKEILTRIDKNNGVNKK